MRKFFAGLTAILFVSAALPVNAANHRENVFHTGMFTLVAGQGFRAHVVNVRSALPAAGVNCTAEITVYGSNGTEATAQTFELDENEAEMLQVTPAVGGPSVQQFRARAMHTTDPENCSLVYTGEVFEIVGGKSSLSIDFRPCFNPQPEPPGRFC
jgi:hypothetical protein